MAADCDDTNLRIYQRTSSYTLNETLSAGFGYIDMEISPDRQWVITTVPLVNAIQVYKLDTGTGSSITNQTINTISGAIALNDDMSIMAVATTGTNHPVYTHTGI